MKSFLIASDLKASVLNKFLSPFFDLRNYPIGISLAQQNMSDLLKEAQQDQCEPSLVTSAVFPMIATSQDIIYSYFS